MWDTIVEYFSTLDERPLERMGLLVGGMLLLWIIEGAIPLLTLRYKRQLIAMKCISNCLQLPKLD